MHGAHTIDGCVMHLGVERELTVLQTLDDVHFPEGARAIEESGVQARREYKKFAVAAG